MSALCVHLEGTDTSYSSLVGRIRYQQNTEKGGVVGLLGSRVVVATVLLLLSFQLDHVKVANWIPS